MDILPSHCFTDKDLSEGKVPTKDDSNIQEYKFLGYTILVGRNAYSNENLVKNHPHKTCYWFHAFRAKGPHVILCTNGQSQPEEVVLRKAASLAILNMSEHPVILVAPLADVYKPSGDVHTTTGIWKTWRKETIQL